VVTGAMTAVPSLCVEYSRSQTMRDAAGDSANLSGTDSGGLVWPQVRIEMRFLTKKGEQAPEIAAKGIHVLDNGFEVKGANIERERAPLSICLVVDESGSLFDKAQLQVAAARAAIAAMQPGDEMAIAVFNKHGMLKQDFTDDTKKLDRPLGNLTFWGPSDLFDTLIATMDHVFKHSRYRSRVLLVLSDGGNNESASNLRQTVDQLNAIDGPTLYSMTMKSSDEEKGDFENLRKLANATGGDAVKIEPRGIDVEETIRALMQEAHDRYTIVYTPFQQVRDGRLHKVEVKVGEIAESTTKIRAVVREYHAPAN
jgi:VWFA-related protein